MHSYNGLDWIRCDLVWRVPGDSHQIMRAILLICSFLTLPSTSSSAGQPTFTDLPNELQHIIGKDVDFCEYFEALNTLQGVPVNMDFGMTRLLGAAKKERSLSLDNDKQRVEKQRILKSVRAFARLYSKLPVVFKETEADVNVNVDADAEDLGRWAKVFESSYEACSSFSESPTWRQACMAGLFGHNTLITLLPYLSKDFCAHNKALLLQTACLIGDSDSLKAIVESLVILKDDVLTMVSARDIVFSGSVPFFEGLSKFLPNLREKRLDLIIEATILRHPDTFIRVLEMSKPVALDEVEQITDSLHRLPIFSHTMFGNKRPQVLAHQALRVAAQHNHLPIIRLLLPISIKGVMRSIVGRLIKDMMIEAGKNNHRGVLEFLMWESDGYCIKVAQHYVNNAFEAAVEEGRVEIMNFLGGYDKDGNLVAPRLGLKALRPETLEKAIKINRNWSGIKHLGLFKQVDPRFAQFELVDHENFALCMACEAGDYEMFEYLLQQTSNGEFVFTLTNPAVDDNMPLISACWSGDRRIVERLLERDISGNYIYKGIDPSAQDYEAIAQVCSGKDLELVKFLLKRKDGNYVLPQIKGVNLCRALFTAIEHNQKGIVEFLLSKSSDGSYLLPGVEVTTEMLRTGDPSPELRSLLAMHLPRPQRINA